MAVTPSEETKPEKLRKKHFPKATLIFQTLPMTICISVLTHLHSANTEIYFEPKVVQASIDIKLYLEYLKKATTKKCYLSVIKAKVCKNYVRRTCPIKLILIVLSSIRFVGLEMYGF
jgi:hypothetical protein